MPDNAVLAIASHPDDIELMMGGTFALLGKAGFELHYMNIANGSMGTDRETRDSIIARRTAESRAAAEMFGATFHEPLVDDLDVYYDRVLPRKVGAVIREVKPRIMLVQSPQDYMEDHTNACRLAVSAAFFRGMFNYVTDPPRSPWGGQMTIYHALPWGLRDPLRRVVRAGLYVNVESVLKLKRDALACHLSQKTWLDVSQGMDSYLIAMEEMAEKVGKMSKVFTHAEGWRRHVHMGFCGEHDDPLRDALGSLAHVCEEYEAELNGPLA
ncbi:MAG: PIG-L family deacetylase [Candidatus Hydrogenedentes bacterium]|nr:PIG-L family deacetylase [Candidatus Hydrogenedentota bacterium]